MTLNLLRVSGLDIFKQLQIEEALLRTTSENWLILNKGSAPAIVMGISGRPEELINFDRAGALNLPLIKRYSGGGTVLVDENTVFFSLILNKEHLDCAAFPRPIMKWVGEEISPAFASIPFALNETDFTIGEHKCGGNAQYIQKERIVHHTTFLWDFDLDKMQVLLHPEKKPSYRQERSHGEFLTGLKNFLPCCESWMSALATSFSSRFRLHERSLEELEEIIQRPHRRSTTLLETFRSSPVEKRNR